MICLTCAFTVLSDIPSASPISLFDLPSEISASTSRWRLVSACQGRCATSGVASVVIRFAQHQRHECPARPHPLERRNQNLEPKAHGQKSPVRPSARSSEPAPDRRQSAIARIGVCGAAAANNTRSTKSICRQVAPPRRMTENSAPCRNRRTKSAAASTSVTRHRRCCWPSASLRQSRRNALGSTIARCRRVGATNAPVSAEADRGKARQLALKKSYISKAAPLRFRLSGKTLRQIESTR